MTEMTVTWELDRSVVTADFEPDEEIGTQIGREIGSGIGV